MDYKEKYEKLHRFVKDLYPHMSEYCKEKVKGYITELKESENERIREDIIIIVNEFWEKIGSIHPEFSTHSEMLAWLEKQGEQKPAIIIPKYRVGDTIRIKNSDAEYTITEISDGYYRGKGWCLDIAAGDESGDYELVKQNLADKLEPKFRIEKGKWYVCTNTFVSRGKIIAIKGQTYQSQQENDTITCENNCLFIDRHDGKASDYFRYWTIKDAKDGDMLYLQKDEKEHIIIYKGVLKERFRTFASVYCAYNGIIDAFCSANVSRYIDIAYGGIMPATKEQCDLLFQKMKEAGYEWNAEKKELKKIEHKPILDIEIPFGAKDSELQEATYFIPEGFHVEIKDDKVVIKKGEQKPAWGEEDVEMCQETIDWFEKKCFPYALEHENPARER